MLGEVVSYLLSSMLGNVVGSLFNCERVTRLGVVVGSSFASVVGGDGG